MVCSVADRTAHAADRSYNPYSKIERGSVGLTRITLSVENATGSTIRCTASLAHWYSQTLGLAAPGGVLDTVLWHDPETGELSLLNADTDRMPLEAVWCERAGSGRETRSRLRLRFRRGDAPSVRRHVCVLRRDGDLTCGDPDG